MGDTIYIEVDHDDLKRLYKALDKSTSGLQRSLRNAINRTETAALKQIKAGRSQGYTIKASRFNSDITKQTASVAHLDATIKAEGRTHTLKYFKTTAPKSGGKTDIVRTGLKKLVNDAGNKAFMGAGGAIDGLMAQRTGASRYPLRVLASVSTPKMVEQIFKGERGGQGEMQITVQERLHTEIMAEIAKTKPI